MKTIKAVLKEPEQSNDGTIWHPERMAELHYIDSKYEVYSYDCGDGIWGTYWDTFEEMEKDLGKETVDKWIKGGYEDMEIEIPFSFVEKEGYSILLRKTQKPVHVSVEDMRNMCTDGCIELPDGSLTEPDGEGSPLVNMGLI